MIHPLLHKLATGGVTLTRYDIYLGDRVVGNAELIEEGLYLIIHAQCFGLPQDFYRLILEIRDENLDLGVCLHNNGTYFWNKRIPKKMLLGSDIKLSLITTQTKKNTAFVPVASTSAFPYFANIANAYYREEAGIKGVCITDFSPNALDY